VFYKTSNAKIKGSDKRGLYTMTLHGKSARKSILQNIRYKNR